MQNGSSSFRENKSITSRCASVPNWGILWQLLPNIVLPIKTTIFFMCTTPRCTVYPKKYAHGFCFAVVIHWLIFPYPPGLLHWHCGNLTIAPVPAKQPWWIWINTSCELFMNDCITTTKQSTTKPGAYFLGYTVHPFCWKPQQSVTFIWLSLTSLPSKSFNFGL